MQELYTIHPASVNETNEGWVWFKEPDLPSRTIVKIENVGTRYYVFCESRKIDAYFIENYRKTRCPELENPDDSLFISEWFRNALGGFDPTSHSKKKVLLNVTPMKSWRWNSLRAASHHPNIVARLGTRLGVVGVWLGVVALAPIILEFTGWPKCSKLIALTVFALVLAVVGVHMCRGVNRRG
ncbi:MAG: hypothetical protein WCE53_14665 [Candidatus Acidiferrum sp.]